MLRVQNGTFYELLASKIPNFLLVRPLRGTRVLLHVSVGGHPQLLNSLRELANGRQVVHQVLGNPGNDLKWTMALEGTLLLMSSEIHRAGGTPPPPKLPQWDWSQAVPADPRLGQRDLANDALEAWPLLQSPIARLAPLA